MAHIVELVKKGFYDGQRVHRAIAGFSFNLAIRRPATLAARSLGTRGRGIERDSRSASRRSPRSECIRQAQSASLTWGTGAGRQPDLHHAGAASDLDGQYAVFGRVIEGVDVPARLQVGDEIRRVYVR